ncbi:hypothetical protein [Dyadobacter fermentans]|uniref:hypothetical protein n=1 Tax=Dyadobacter fermentans TaxID=94254 RepID=UPI001CC101F8|nr:hypothetical protein [Dyadobacter fermentans]MBZ1363043.1 hypothetical protein [Dyadobacter fermentans]
MKNISKIMLSVVFITLFAACNDDLNPAVDTAYFDRKMPQAQTEKDAIKKLYGFYNESSKDKQYYEVVQKAGIILNFSPTRKLLSLCGDQGSGWSGQYKNFDEAFLKKLVDDKVTFDELLFPERENRLDTLYRATLMVNDPFDASIKTNGTPK